jgi:hypothetical protein
MARGDAKRKRENRALRAKAEKKVNIIITRLMSSSPFPYETPLFKLTGMQSFKFSCRISILLSYLTAAKRAQRKNPTQTICLQV